MLIESVNFNLGEMLDEIYTVMVYLANQKNLELEIQLDSLIPEQIVGDVLKLKQILINLLSNGVKFTHEGKVQLEVDLIKREEQTCILAFCVSDTGIGIKEADQDKILEPFIQGDASTTRKYGGTGLGLSICDRYIRQMSEGREGLALKSEYGKGSIFNFKMKFDLVDKVADREEEAVMISSLHDRKRVLLVDNNEMNLEVGRRMLERLGLEVSLSKSGIEAVEQVQRERYDLILMDIRMPVMDGYEATRCIRAQIGYKDIPIIALSADVVAEVIEEVKACGMNDYISKPVSIQQLYKAVSYYLEIKDKEIIEPASVADNQMTFSYFDEGRCLEQLDGDREIMLWLIQTFLKEGKSYKNAINEALAKLDCKECRRLLHDLRPLLGNLCCQSLYQIATRLSEEIKQGEPSSLAFFNEIWDQTLCQLEAYIEGADRKACLDQVNEAEVDDGLKQLLALCENWDMKAIEFIKKYESILNKRFSKEWVEHLKQAITQYEFDEAMDLLDKVIAF